jgi:UDP-N-acetyl-D-glucosamine dehydrogenase
MHDGRRMQTVPLSDEVLQQCDCAVIITNHSAFDYERIVTLAPAVVDTRNATRHIQGELRAKITVL